MIGQLTILVNVALSSSIRWKPDTRGLQKELPADLAMRMMFDLTLLACSTFEIRTWLSELTCSKVSVKTQHHSHELAGALNQENLYSYHSEIPLISPASSLRSKRALVHFAIRKTSLSDTASCPPVLAV
jgi:hypothetical protein